MFKQFYIFHLICLYTALTYCVIYRGVYNCDLSGSSKNSVMEEKIRRLSNFGFSESERHENVSQTNESFLEPFPNFIIQYGPPRTATTLQFQVLCLMMALQHEDEITSVACNRNLSYKYNVIKTHTIGKYLMRIPSNSWIFMTSGAHKRNILHGIRNIKDKQIRIVYVADIDLVSKRGHFIAYEYQRFFGVSNDKMKIIVEYLRYWDILRLCCGKQMSADWRNHLSPEPNYEWHHDPHSPTYPACEMYNISQVEQLFINTYAFQKFAHIDSLVHVIGRPSNVDDKLNGQYCVRCNIDISQKRM
ncbi:uncharacterized protein LOC123549938 [Mercenaria mercenaria]|uniref:uncharacterized protein LOC123549938 n=1 Tax=Mercenaria mercenaria TaxID=6596 RepID=UPI00234FAAF3|nr:uncharacterized protein LOC123549938 [Mercenaria mercenaria]